MFPGQGERWRVTVNGLPHSWLPFEGIHTLLGAVPAVIHPAPEEVAVIGLGSGETAWAVACREETQRVRVFEIAASQPRLLRPGAAGRALSVARRAALRPARDASRRPTGARRSRAHERRYDVIEVDALYLTSAGSGNLYSVEFFELCAKRLKPGGLVCSQKPAGASGLTFAEASPPRAGLRQHGDRQQRADPDRRRGVGSRLRPGVARRFDAESLAGIRARLERGGAWTAQPAGPVGFNRDLFPRDEFGTPAGW